MFGKKKDEKAELVVIENDETGKWDVVDQDTNVVSSHDSEELATEAMNNPPDEDKEDSKEENKEESKTETKTGKKPKGKKPVAKKPNNGEGISFATAVKQAAKDKRIVRRTDRVRLKVVKANKFYKVGQIIRPHVVYAEQLITDKIAVEAPIEKEAKSKKK